MIVVFVNTNFNGEKNAMGFSALACVVQPHAERPLINTCLSHEVLRGLHSMTSVLLLFLDHV